MPLDSFHVTLELKIDTFDPQDIFIRLVGYNDMSKGKLIIHPHIKFSFTELCCDCHSVLPTKEKKS
jgi:hypothetical protein